MKKAVFPGSFDPITNGHVDVITRALPLFDEIIIAIGTNADKKYMFSLEERIGFIKETFANEPKIKVANYKGLTIDFCKEQKADFLLRGLRNPADFEFENIEGRKKPKRIWDAIEVKPGIWGISMDLKKLLHRKRESEN